MKKVLVLLSILSISQGSLLLSYDNMNAFLSDNSKVKQICLNLPKSRFFWKSGPEQACDCLDENLALLNEEYIIFMQTNKGNVIEGDVKAADKEIVEKLVLNKKFRSDVDRIAKLLHPEKHLLAEECNEFLLAMEKAYNSSRDKAAETLKK